MGFNFGMHDFMIGVIAHVVLLVVGFASSFLFKAQPVGEELTLWGWLRKRKLMQQQSVS